MDYRLPDVRVPEPHGADEFRPALVKLWAMAAVSFLMMPVGAVAASLWWNQVELPGGRVLTAKAGVVGLLAIPVGFLLALVAIALVASAKRLVIGEKSLQLFSRRGEVVRIPYQNVAEVYVRGESVAGVVVIRLHNRHDPATVVPPWTKDHYEIQVLTYGKPLGTIHKAVWRRLAAFRGV